MLQSTFSAQTFTECFSRPGTVRELVTLLRTHRSGQLLVFALSSASHIVGNKDSLDWMDKCTDGQLVDIQEKK